MPRLPKYIKKNNFTWFLKNNNTYIKDSRLYFKLKVMQGYSFKTSIPQDGRLISVRFIPKNGNFVLEIVYEIEVPDITEHNNNYVSIDLGINNFITMSNNIGQRPTIIKGGFVKSKNQWYNKRRADKYSKLTDTYWSKHLDRITVIRYNRIKNYMHHVSKYVIDFCKANKIDNVIVGLNETWKQEVNMGDRVNQNFVFIPYDMFIKQLQYKCQDNGMRLITHEESYTSGTSALDNELPIKENYNKKRRIKRGLFRSNDGILINSDVNGSIQIAKKVNPNIFQEYGLEGCLNPIIIKDVFSCYKQSA
jgi:putative transposase